jgi:Ca-activated chloride channel family protein
VVQVVQDVWWYTKRHTNVYLVVDTSGSMEGEKLESVQEALRIFVEQIKGDMERVGLIEFASDVYDVVEMDNLGRNRETLMEGIDGLWAGGDTSLLDGVKVAYDRLQKRGDAERINAIVVMTDGLENDSSTSLYELVTEIEDGNVRGVPVHVFCIAYGSDADMDTLRAIAEASGGDVRRGDPETIRQLYKILSTYF